MITSIVLTGCYDVKLNSRKMFKVGEHTLSAEKDIPFIRYRFNEYTDKEIEYIKESKKKFNRVTHLAEINMTEDIVNTLNKLDAVENIARFVYSEITEEDVKNGTVSETVANILRALGDSVNKIDRFMLRDKSNSLDTVTAKRIIEQAAKISGIREENFGICCSPLSFGELACLSAIKAREIMSKYSDIADVALPSANHQCMNCCGCIRYIIVDNDTEPVLEVTKTKKSGTAETKVKTETQKSSNKPKTQLQPGMFRL